MFQQRLSENLIKTIFILTSKKSIKINLDNFLRILFTKATSEILQIYIITLEKKKFTPQP